MANAIYKKLFSATYTVQDFVDEFKITFPVFVPIYNGEVPPEDKTDEILAFDVMLAIFILPESLPKFFDRDELKIIVKYMLAHLLAYAGITNSKGTGNNGQAFTSLMRLANSKSADGLSISYMDIAKLKGEMFATLLQFLQTTYYGQIVALFLAKIAGSGGVYAA